MLLFATFFSPLKILNFPPCRGKPCRLWCEVVFFFNMSQAQTVLFGNAVYFTQPPIIYSVQPGAHIDKCFQHQVFTQWDVMDVKSLKTPGALTAWAAARLSREEKHTTQNRINGSEGWCACVRAHGGLCAYLFVLLWR